VRWQEFESRFDFSWEYCNGSANAADPISHYSTVMCTLMSMLVEWASAGDDSVPGGLLRQIVNGCASDEWFADEKLTAALTFSDGVWCRGSQIVVPDAENLRQNCLSAHHDTRFAGHLGRDRIVQLVLQTYWLPSLERDVQQYVPTCDHCQRNKKKKTKQKIAPFSINFMRSHVLYQAAQCNKASNEKPAGLLQPLPVPDFRWQ